MSLLAIDTSLDRLNLCLLDGERARATSLKGLGRQDLALNKALERVVPDPAAMKDVSLIAACTGPGRFTGIRVGVAFAVLLGKSLEIPVAGLQALRALAWQAVFEARKRGLPAPSLVCAARPVVRDELFWGLYRVSSDGEVASESPDAWGAPAALRKGFPKLKEPVVFIGESARAAAQASGHRAAVVIEAPLSAEALARRARFLSEHGAPLPAPEPYYLKPGNYEKNVKA